MIFVTGDTHGSNDILKLNETNFPQQLKMSKKDYVIIAGDFGLLFYNDHSEKIWLKWLEERNFTTLWIDGNHENYDLIESYPVIEWNGGKARKISDSIIQLMRGQVFSINGINIFTFGGAVSIDKAYRTPGETWWQQELPSKEEMREGLRNLRKVDYEVDYIITHDCSKNLLYEMYGTDQAYRYSEDLNLYFDTLENIVTYKHWYFGHHHMDIINICNKHTVLYNYLEFGK
jgi:predicted phosphodiesterase